MAVIGCPAAPTHVNGSTHFTSLATPSRGSTETAVWTVEMAPHTPATPHSLTREEVFVVLSGEAAVTMDGIRTTAHGGDAIVVPCGVQFELANETDETLRLLCCMPVGGQGIIGDSEPFTPPWAE